MAEMVRGRTGVDLLLGALQVLVAVLDPVGVLALAGALGDRQELRRLGGVATRRQLLRVCTEHALAKAMRTGEVVRPARGRYVLCPRGAVSPRPMRSTWAATSPEAAQPAPNARTSAARLRTLASENSRASSPGWSGTLT